MTYEEAKTIQSQLEARNNIYKAALKEFDKYGKGPMNMTPDHVRAMPEWREAKTAYENDTARLKQFYTWFNRTFKKEIRAEYNQRKANGTYGHRE